MIASLPADCNICVGIDLAGGGIPQHVRLPATGVG